MAKLHLLTLPEVITIFGDPAMYKDPSGDFDEELWQKTILSAIPLPAPLPLSWNHLIHVYRIRCHWRIAKPLRSALEKIYEVDLWNELSDTGGCYNFRPNVNNKRAPSRHCWGIAIDLDVMDNPNRAKGDMHPTVIRVMEDHGFMWGGRFQKPDPMHFEWSKEIV